MMRLQTLESRDRSQLLERVASDNKDDFTLQMLKLLRKYLEQRRLQ